MKTGAKIMNSFNSKVEVMSIEYKLRFFTLFLGLEFFLDLGCFKNREDFLEIFYLDNDTLEVYLELLFFNLQSFKFNLF